MLDPQATQPRKETEIPAASPKTRRRIDWRRGARLLSEGRMPEEAAVALGIDGERFWRHLETSPAFQRQIAAAIQQRNELVTLLDDMGVRSSARIRAAEELLARVERGEPVG